MQAKWRKWHGLEPAWLAPHLTSNQAPFQFGSLPFFSALDNMVLSQAKIPERKILDRMRIELTTQSLQDSVATLAHACPSLTRRRSLLVLECSWLRHDFDPSVYSRATRYPANWIGGYLSLNTIRTTSRLNTFVDSGGFLRIIVSQKNHPILQCKLTQ